MSAYGNISCEWCGESYFEVEEHVCEVIKLIEEIDWLRKTLKDAINHPEEYKHMRDDAVITPTQAALIKRAQECDEC